MNSVPVVNSCVQMCQLIYKENIYQSQNNISNIRVGVILKYMVKKMKRSGRE